MQEVAPDVETQCQKIFYSTWTEYFPKKIVPSNFKVSDAEYFCFCFERTVFIESENWWCLTSILRMWVFQITLANPGNSLRYNVYLFEFSLRPRPFHGILEGVPVTSQQYARCCWALSASHTRPLNLGFSLYRSQISGHHSVLNPDTGKMSETTDKMIKKGRQTLQFSTND